MTQYTPSSLDRRRALMLAGSGLASLGLGGPALAAGETGLPPSPPSGVARVHGIAMHGAPALPPGFPNFPYTNPQAPKSGRLRLGQQGSFDSLNPFIIKGVPAYGLREYVFESLMARSADEPFTLYGLIAGAIEVPRDRSSITFHLREEARFADGHPVRSGDVRFSWSVLKEHGWPYQRSYYRKVVDITTPDDLTVRLAFDADDREMPLIMGLMPILPAHRLTAETFQRTTLEPPLGSGPYEVARTDAGRSVVYRRLPDYWGRHLAVNVGRFNFDEVRVDYYRDPSALLEAFKTGEIDVRPEDNPSRWVEGYGDRPADGAHIVKREFPLGTPAGMSGLALNTRRSLFQDQRVRKALISLFDGAWINRTLYDGMYRRTDSYFARSALASTGKPADPIERGLLAPFPSVVPADILEGRWRLPQTDGSGGNREGFTAAHLLLAEAGYVLDGRTLRDGRTGRPVSIEFLASTRAQERLMLAFGRTLERVGIGLTVRQVDSAQYWSRLKSFDFDMVQWTWGASLSPGNEQANRWSQAAADTEGSLNYPGVRSAAVDAMIAALLSAEERPAFEAAVRALDRVLLAGDYVIPLFYAPGQWVAHWSRIAAPEQTALAGADFDTWWAAGV